MFSKIVLDVRSVHAVHYWWIQKSALKEKGLERRNEVLITEDLVVLLDNHTADRDPNPDTETIPPEPKPCKRDLVHELAMAVLANDTWGAWQLGYLLAKGGGTWK